MSRPRLLAVCLDDGGPADACHAFAEAAGIEAVVLRPILDDVNGDLRRFGLDAVRQHLRSQLAPEDVARLLLPGG